jgi:hypothetical protein
VMRLQAIVIQKTPHLRLLIQDDRTALKRKTIATKNWRQVFKHNQEVTVKTCRQKIGFGFRKSALALVWFVCNNHPSKTND